MNRVLIFLVIFAATITGCRQPENPSEAGEKILFDMSNVIQKTCGFSSVSETWKELCPLSNTAAVNRATASESGEEMLTKAFTPMHFSPKGLGHVVVSVTPKHLPSTIGAHIEFLRQKHPDSKAVLGSLEREGDDEPAKHWLLLMDENGHTLFVWQFSLLGLSVKWEHNPKYPGPLWQMLQRQTSQFAQTEPAMRYLLNGTSLLPQENAWLLSQIETVSHSMKMTWTQGPSGHMLNMVTDSEKLTKRLEAYRQESQNGQSMFHNAENTRLHAEISRLTSKLAQTNQEEQTPQNPDIVLPPSRPAAENAELNRVRQQLALVQLQLTQAREQREPARPQVAVEMPPLQLSQRAAQQATQRATSLQTENEELAKQLRFSRLHPYIKNDLDTHFNQLSEMTDDTETLNWTFGPDKKLFTLDDRDSPETVDKLTQYKNILARENDILWSDNENLVDKINMLEWQNEYFLEHAAKSDWENERNKIKIQQMKKSLLNEAEYADKADMKNGELAAYITKINKKKTYPNSTFKQASGNHLTIDTSAPASPVHEPPTPDSIGGQLYISNEDFSSDSTNDDFPSMQSAINDISGIILRDVASKFGGNVENKFLDGISASPVGTKSAKIAGILSSAIQHQTQRDLKVVENGYATIIKKEEKELLEVRENLRQAEDKKKTAVIELKRMYNELQAEIESIEKEIESIEKGTKENEDMGIVLLHTNYELNRKRQLLVDIEKTLKIFDENLSGDDDLSEKREPIIISD